MTLDYENGNKPLRVRMPDSWRNAITAAAQARGMSDAEWVRSLILKALPKDVAKSLPPVSAGKPRKHDSS